MAFPPAREFFSTSNTRTPRFASKTVRAFPAELRRAARRELLYLHDAAELRDLRVPPGNRLEALKGELKGHQSIRINDRWRVVFRWENGNAAEVRVIDYH